MAIHAIVADMPSYGYRRVGAPLRRAALAERRPPPNHKRVYRIMKAHGLLLQRHAGGVEAHHHDGRIAVDRSNLRWCSDGFELGCDNGEKVRVAFALDCCDREAISFVATTEGIKGEDVRDLMTVAIEARFGPVNRLPAVIEWLTDNGSGYIAGETPPLRSRDRLRTVDDPGPEPAVQRHGRGLRADHQARLRQGQSDAIGRSRHASAAGMVRPLQPASPAQGAGIPFAKRVHRRPFNRGGRVRSLRGNNNSHPRHNFFGVVALERLWL